MVILPYAVSSLIAILYGISAVTEKMALQVFTAKYVFIASGLLYGLAALVYMCFHFQEFQKHLRHPNMWHHSLVVISALLATIIPMYLWFHLLHDNDRVHVWTAITYSAPMFTLLFVYLLLDDKITGWNVLGVILVVIGVILLAYDNL